MAKIGIVNFGMGNLKSIEGKVKRLGHEVLIVNEAHDVSQCQKFILPGVGNFSQGIRNLRSSPAFSNFQKAVIEDKAPVLGICLGMQLLTSFSEEGGVEGLNWIPGKSIKFKFDSSSQYRVPHVGWNKVLWETNFSLMKGIHSGKRFYFTHSYYVLVDNPPHSLARTEYGVNFDSIISRDNILGTQFHPEKSHQYGLDLIANFLGGVDAPS